MSATGRDVWVYVEHLRRTVAPYTPELLGAGREIAAALGGGLTAIVLGDEVESLTSTLGSADRILCVSDPALAAFVPEGHAAALRFLAQAQAPRLWLFGATSMGMDLATLLSATLPLPLVVNCRSAAVEDGRVVVTSQMCGGKLLCEAEVAGPAALTLLPGTFAALPPVPAQPSQVERAPLPGVGEGLHMTATRLLEPQAGDVDITRAPILVSVGRGIQRKENLPMFEELAELLGGAVSASRPVVDQGWLSLDRQVGKSGMTVKPKLYLALGISGASEHVEGMKDADLIIAVNSDPRAPIFEVADYGVATDLFEIAPVLTDALKKRRSEAA